MATNNRIYWAVEALGLAPKDSIDYSEVHGLQSVGITTTFNLEQVFEIGQLAIYENIEDIPDIEVTAEKVIDGYPLLYHLATRNAPSTTLAGRSNQKCEAVLSIFGDTQDSASGVPVSEVNMSGMYVSSLTYTMPVDGSCTESLTLVGNNKLWKSTGFTFQGQLFDNADVPLALNSVSGGVQRRENVVFDSIVDGTVTLLPSDIDGISSSGTNDRDTNSVFGAHVQNITVSADLGREGINELGRKGPYFRFVNFPVEVTTEVEVMSLSGDQVSATEAGVLGNSENLTADQIIIVLQDSTKLDLGSQNKLANVSYGGADAGGGNATNTYSFTTFNDLDVTHNQDPG